MGHLKILKLQWGALKSKFENFSIKWSYRLQMMIEFQMRPQNLNQQYFTLFGPKMVENWILSVFDHF